MIGREGGGGRGEGGRFEVVVGQACEECVRQMSGRCQEGVRKALVGEDVGFQIAKI
jgi:hypothetical protein